MLRAAAYAGPPDYRSVGRHAVFPQVSHDEIARLNYLAQIGLHLSKRVAPLVRVAGDAGGAEPTQHTPSRTWPALWQLTREQRQQAGRWTTLCQAETLAVAAALLTDGDPRLRLDPDATSAGTLAAIDRRCLADNYYVEGFPGDVSGAAAYDLTTFARTLGVFGRYADCAGRAIVQWVRRSLPSFKPRRILEIGAAVGHTLLPIAQAFPKAEVVGVDAAAPAVRYGLARAKSLGFENVCFVQADAANLDCFDDASFDWIQTTTLLHELSHASMVAIFSETFRLLRPRGIVLHMEQPREETWGPLAERATDGANLDEMLVDAGFARSALIRGGVPLETGRRRGVDDDTGREAEWQLIGARR